MKKKIIIVLSIIFSLVFIGLLINYIVTKITKVEVTLVEDLTVEFNDTKKVSDFIKSINGEIIDDYKIDTTIVGKKEIVVKYINDYHIKVKYTFEIEVIDTVKPLIWLNSTYKVKKGSNIDLTKKILCGDNYDNNPKCYIEGEYDLNKAGKYNLVFKAIDSSGNEEQKNFVLNVYEPVSGSSTGVGTSSTLTSYTSFKEIVKDHKTDKTKIGIDVSHWQGDIDFEKLKTSGVEFMMIRVGTGETGSYKLDKKFIRNITNANKYGIEVGIYFYSYTNSITNAIKDANWVLEQIKDYDVTLPIAFDWEEWSDFNSYNLSFFGLTNVANEFLNTITKAGYKGMLYSSKTYLEKIWFPTKYDIWLAHYTDKTDYNGKYYMWQLCSDGRVDGINGYVDIDIMYTK